MVRELNAKLRGIAIALTAILVFLMLKEDKKEIKKKSHGFQSEEFDDIW